MPEHNPGQMGGTMRLGKRRTLFQTKNSVMSKSCRFRPPSGTARLVRKPVLGYSWGSEGPGWPFGFHSCFQVFSPFLLTFFQDAPG